MAQVPERTRRIAAATLAVFLLSTEPCLGLEKQIYFGVSQSCQADASVSEELASPPGTRRTDGTAEFDSGNVIGAHLISWMKIKAGWGDNPEVNESYGIATDAGRLFLSGKSNDLDLSLLGVALVHRWNRPSGAVQPYLGFGPYYAEGSMEVDLRPDAQIPVEVEADGLLAGFKAGIFIPTADRGRGMVVEARHLAGKVSGKSFRGNDEATIDIGVTQIFLGFAFDVQDAQAREPTRD